MDFIINRVGQTRPYGFKYFPVTGRFERSIPKKFDSKGKIGHINYKNRKYQRIMYLSKEYRLHRFAYLMKNEFLPDGIIGGKGMVVDHINGNSSDNRWENLRIVEKRINDQNKEKHRQGNLCGTKRANKTKGERWESRIVINKKLIHIGTFDTALEAHNAYILECKKLNDKLDTTQQKTK